MCIRDSCLSFHVQLGKDSRRKGSGAGFPVTLEKCLGALSILHKKPGAQPSATDSFRRSAGSGQGGATVRSHSVTAGYLGLLTFWKRNRKPAPFPILRRPSYLSKKSHQKIHLKLQPSTIYRTFKIPVVASLCMQLVAPENPSVAYAPGIHLPLADRAVSLCLFFF